MSQCVDVVVAEAWRYRTVREAPSLSNRGPQIDYWLLEAGVGTGLPWCAAFVGQVGRQALGHRWPLPRTAGVQAIYDWAVGARRVVDVPMRGDLFVQWHENLKRYAHVGFVTAVSPATFATIEGNTNPSGGRDGYGVFERTRARAAGTKYIRWALSVEDPCSTS